MRPTDLRRVVQIILEISWDLGMHNISSTEPSFCIFINQGRLEYLKLEVIVFIHASHSCMDYSYFKNKMKVFPIWFPTSFIYW